jgi:hypothetical protein
MLNETFQLKVAWMHGGYLNIPGMILLKSLYGFSILLCAKDSFIEGFA